MSKSLIRSPGARAAAAATLGLVILAVWALPGAAATAHRAHRAAPRLVLVSRAPITIAGHNFTPRARVRVRLVSARTVSRTPVASRAGAFTVTFGTVLDRCSGWSVTASQQNRTTVVLRGAKPQCAPAGTP